jgi:hypothetical protein
MENLCSRSNKNHFKNKLIRFEDGRENFFKLFVDPRETKNLLNASLIEADYNNYIFYAIR